LLLNTIFLDILFDQNQAIKGYPEVSE